MSSALLSEAARIASQFDYPAAEVQRGVTEYIREIDEGLSKEHTTLSQIPTYVTAVPNGTEKVRFTTNQLPSTKQQLTWSLAGFVPGSRSRRHQLPRVLDRSTWRHYLLPYPVQDHDSS